MDAGGLLFSTRFRRLFGLNLNHELYTTRNRLLLTTSSSNNLRGSLLYRIHYCYSLSSACLRDIRFLVSNFSIFILFYFNY
jgi:hypothetical protein